MGPLADSNAVLVKKILPQHHTAITLLGGLLTAPGTEQVEWLDLACGKGQIISQFERNIAELNLREKIAYHAYDIKDEHTRVSEKIARSLNFRSVDVKIGEMEHFPNIFPPEQKFSFISFTNTVHELRPTLVGSLLIALILRLSDTGILYIYDMETLPLPELGAVPWDGDDFRNLLSEIFKDLGCQPIPLIVQRWEHSSCSGWSVNLQRNYLRVSDAVITENTERAATGATAVIIAVLKYKLKITAEELEALTRFGPDNEEEKKRTIKLLYDFWSLERALHQIT
jgi:hypothetical protein